MTPNTFKPGDIVYRGKIRDEITALFGTNMANLATAVSRSIDELLTEAQAYILFPELKPREPFKIEREVTWIRDYKSGKVRLVAVDTEFDILVGKTGTMTFVEKLKE